MGIEPLIIALLGTLISTLITLYFRMCLGSSSPCMFQFVWVQSTFSLTSVPVMKTKAVAYVTYRPKQFLKAYHSLQRTVLFCFFIANIVTYIWKLAWDYKQKKDMTFA